MNIKGNEIQINDTLHYGTRTAQVVAIIKEYKTTIAVKLSNGEEISIRKTSTIKVDR